VKLPYKPVPSPVALIFSVGALTMIGVPPLPRTFFFLRRLLSRRLPREDTLFPLSADTLSFFFFCWCLVERIFPFSPPSYFPLAAPLFQLLRFWTYVEPKRSGRPRPSTFTSDWTPQASPLLADVLLFFFSTPVARYRGLVPELP